MEPQNQLLLAQSFSEGLCMGLVGNMWGFADKIRKLD